jgi:outer membrane receptor protein involved in Fe transport
LTRRPILASERSFSQFLLADAFGGGLTPVGSTAGPGGRFESITADIFGIGQNYISPGATFSQPGVSRPFIFGSAGSLGDLFNFEPYNYLMTPERRWFGNGRVDYEISPAARLYGEITYIDNKTSQQLAPAPIFTLTTFDVNAIAPHLSATDLAQLQLISQFDPFIFGTPPGEVSLFVDYRPLQVGPRRMIENRKAWDGLVGLTGDVGPLTYDISYSYAQTNKRTLSTGEINLLEFNTLAGNGTCNIFGPSLLSDSCIAGISLPLTSREHIRQEIGQATLSGPLVALPLSNDPAKFVLGVEWRSMRGAYTPDPNEAISTSSITTPLAGHYSSEEVFGELSVPIIERAALHVLELDGGARYSHYSLSNVHSEWTWYGGAKLAPSPDIAFRGQFQRTLRVPNLAELFSVSTLDFPFVLDPCSIYASDFSDKVRQLCIASGVPAANVFNFDPGVQFPATIGGNPSLKAETGSSWTAGAVFTPRFIPGLSGSIDYFDIRLHHTIESIGAGTIVDACFLSIQDLNSPLCKAITRDPATGAIAMIDARIQNVGSKRTSGVDATIDYLVPIHASVTGSGHSKLAWQFVGTWLNKSSFQILALPGQPTYRCEGRFGLDCGNPQPRLTWQSRLSWIDGPLTTSVRWRHVGPVRDDQPLTTFAVEHINAYDLVDLAFEVRVNDRFTMDIGSNNLFNKRPPILGSNADFSGNTYPNTYDILGRDFFVSADMHF